MHCDTRNHTCRSVDMTSTDRFFGSGSPFVHGPQKSSITPQENALVTRTLHTSILHTSKPRKTPSPRCVGPMYLTTHMIPEKRTREWTPNGSTTGPNGERDDPNLSPTVNGDDRAVCFDATDGEAAADTRRGDWVELGDASARLSLKTWTTSRKVSENPSRKPENSSQVITCAGQKKHYLMALISSVHYFRHLCVFFLSLGLEPSVIWHELWLKVETHVGRFHNYPHFVRFLQKLNQTGKASESWLFQTHNRSPSFLEKTNEVGVAIMKQAYVGLFRNGFSRFEILLKS